MRTSIYRGTNVEVEAGNSDVIVIRNTATGIELKVSPHIYNGGGILAVYEGEGKTKTSKKGLKTVFRINAV